MTSKLALFDQTLNASLLQPLNANQPDFKAYKTRVKLKILEQRNETSGEKELKFELSRADDFEFLFAEVLNNEKYQTLAKELELIVDFDSFPKEIIKHLLCKNIVNSLEEDGDMDARKKPGYHSIIDHGKPTEINIILDAERNFCIFELFSKTPISKGRIFSLKLYAVRGDHLISHLLKICSSQAAKLTSFHKTSDELGHLKTKCEELMEQNSKLEEYKEQFEELSDKLADLENELELVKEEKENIRVLAEEKEDLVALLQKDLDERDGEIEDIQQELEVVGKMLEEEQNKVDQVHKRNVAHQKEMSKLRSENDTLRRSLDKFEQASKRNDLQQNQQSLDVRKLRELEADLKEKDSMVDSLTVTIGMLRKELEDEKQKSQEVMESFEKLRVENEGIKGRLDMYRNQKFSPGPSAGPTTGLSPFTLQTTMIPTGYKTVLGQNSPYTNSNLRTPFRDATNSTFTPSLTPTPRAFPFNSHLTADDTTGSSLTQTPPVLRNPQ